MNNRKAAAALAQIGEGLKALGNALAEGATLEIDEANLDDFAAAVAARYNAAYCPTCKRSPCVSPAPGSCGTPS